MGLITVAGDSTDIYHYLGQLEADGIIRSFASFELQSGRGSKLGIKTLAVGPTTLSGATTNIGGANVISAGWFVLGVLVYVTTAITGASGSNIGDGTTANKWGANIGLTAGTATTGASFTAGPSLYTANTNIVATAITSNYTAGAMRAVINYIDLTAILS